MNSQAPVTRDRSIHCGGAQCTHYHTKDVILARKSAYEIHKDYSLARRRVWSPFIFIGCDAQPTI